MAVIVLLANGILQQMIQPIAFGAALGIHPLAVLIVTIAGGALFGMIGLVLAAPLTSAATHIAADLARARAAEEADDQPPVDLGARACRSAKALMSHANGWPALFDERVPSVAQRDGAARRAAADRGRQRGHGRAARPPARAG